MSLDNDPLPPLIPNPPTHAKLKDARLHVDPKSNSPYLIIQDLDEGSIRVIKINRQKAKNGFDDWLYLVISDALNVAAQDEKVLVVILTGEGEVRDLVAAF
jgi:1,4-dihydroxy-2-naphthoyl-CoA synthase